MPIIKKRLIHLIDVLARNRAVKNVSFHGQIDLKMDIEYVLIYTGNIETKKNCLYLCNNIDFLTQREVPDSVFLFVHDGGFDISGIKESAKLVSLETQLSLTEVSNYLLLNSNTKLANEALLQMMLDKNDLQKTLDVCAKMFTNPLLVFDNEWRLLAARSDIPVKNEFFLKTGENRGLTVDQVMCLYINKYFEVLNTQKCIVTNCEIADCPLIICQMNSNSDACAGYSIMLCCITPPKEGMILAFQDLSRNLGYLLTADNEKVKRNKQLKSFLAEVIMRDGSTPADIEQWCRKIKIRYSGKFYLVRIDIDKLNAPENFFLRHLTDSIRSILAFDYEGLHYAIVEEQDEIERLYEKLEKAAERFQCRCSVSSRFSNLSKLKKAIIQADSTMYLGTLMAGRQEGLYHSYSKTVFFHADYSLLEGVHTYYLFYKTLPSVPDRLEDYCSIIGAKEQNMALLNTFLSQERHMQRTADAAFLHRNSLTNRIRQITDFFGEELDNPEFRQLLMYAFYILDYKKALEKRNSEEIKQSDKLNI